MARDRLTFRQRDITAAIKAVERAGHKVAKVEIGQDGRIRLELVPPVGNETAPAPVLNPWDKVELDEDSQTT
jgi:hypothetical protein